MDLIPLLFPFSPIETLVLRYPYSSRSHDPSAHLPNSSLSSSTLSKACGHHTFSLPNAAFLHRCLIPFALTNATTNFSLFVELNMEQNELEAFLHHHPEIETAATVSPESLRLQINILLSMGLSDIAVRRTITKRPNILTSPETGLFLNFLHKEAVNLNPIKLERILIRTHPCLFSGLFIRTKLLLNLGFPIEKLGHLLSFIDINKALCDRTVEEIEEIVVFFRRYGWPDTIVRRPALLNLCFYSQLIPRCQFFNYLANGDEESSAILILKRPALLSYSVQHLQSHLEFWKSVGLNAEQIFKIALIYPSIFSISIERKLGPRINFLEQCGLDSEDIFKFLVKAPLFVSLSFEDNLAKKLVFLVKLGYRFRTKEMALAVGSTTRTSTENMQKVIELYFNHGFSCEDVLTMSRKHPQVLHYNFSSLEKKMEFLINNMERKVVVELLKFPAFLGYKLDDRIKHRHEINIASGGKGPSSIISLLCASDKKFYMRANKWIEDGSDSSADQVTF